MRRNDDPQSQQFWKRVDAAAADLQSLVERYMKIQKLERSPAMSDAYKLTDKDGYTRRGQVGETLWTVGAVVKPIGKGGESCGPGVLHAYATPEAAVLLNPIHAEIENPRLFRVSAKSWETDGCKRWTTDSVRVLEELPVPKVTTEEKVAFAIVIAPDLSTREWAVGWLAGKGRSRAAAWAVARVAASYQVYAAAFEAAWSAARAAAWAAVWSAEMLAERLAVGWTADAGAARMAFERRIPLALARARAILAGEFPAERYDEPLKEPRDE